jgi:hypothetical protein
LRIHMPPEILGTDWIKSGNYLYNTNLIPIYICSSGMTVS